ncbi:MAG TPA: M48 family metallopeptidase [Acidobacteriota bacterium]|nr:M48 family metallopeptidase [Acidobacteriota bacterium]
MPKKKSDSRKRFPKIDPISFQHPGDREAIKKLDNMKSIQRLMSRVSGDFLERSFRMINMAQRVQVTPKQCPKIYDMFRESCEILDIKEIPEIFVTTIYDANAFSFGIKKYSVILHTGLLDLLNEDEIRFVIGHELSHIKCNHMMYKTLLYLMTFVGVQIFGYLFKVAAIALLPLEMKLRAWERRAEFSCDRGGLLVVQDPQIAQTALVKLAGASKSLLPSIDMGEVLRQADALRDMDEEFFVRAMRLYHNAFRSHPFPIIRIKELHNWSQSNRYRKILSGDYPKVR